VREECERGLLLAYELSGLLSGPALEYLMKEKTRRVIKSLKIKLKFQTGEGMYRL
jgi:hypothetical protein